MEPTRNGEGLVPAPPRRSSARLDPNECLSLERYLADTESTTPP